MNKKDRTAVAVTVVYMVFVVLLILGGTDFVAVGVAIAPILLYWGVRFAKGNISFLGSKYSD
jgi:hypothetical protein